MISTLENKQASILLKRQTFFQKSRNAGDNILSQSETQLIEALLHDNQNYNLSINRIIINSTIEYLISTGIIKRWYFGESIL